MAFSDDDFERARASLLEAAYDQDRWAEAMEWIQKSAGGWGLQLVGASPKRGVIFQHISGIPGDLVDAWAALGGIDPVKNPRARPAYGPSSFRVYDENDFSTPEERRRSAIYSDLYARGDVPYVAAAKFDAIDDIMIGAFCVRSERQGLPDEDDKAHMSALLPYLRAAIRIQETLEHRAAGLVAGALDNLEVCAVLCTGTGQIVATTQAADAELRSGGYIISRDRVLSPAVRADSASLEAAIARAARAPGKATASTVVLRHAEASPRLAEVAPMPRPNWALNLGAVVMVAIAQPRHAGATALIQQGFGLSQAESEIAVRLAGGGTVSDVAVMRGTSVATVRSQVKTLLAKMNLTSQVELVATIARFLGGVV